MEKPSVARGFDPDTEGQTQAKVLGIVCRYVPGWSAVRLGRQHPVPYRIAVSTDALPTHVYKWIRGSRPVARRCWLLILEAVLHQAQRREGYIKDLEAERGALAERVDELEGLLAEHGAPEADALAR